MNYIEFDFEQFGSGREACLRRSCGAHRYVMDLLINKTGIKNPLDLLVLEPQNGLQLFLCAIAMNNIKENDKDDDFYAITVDACNETEFCFVVCTTDTKNRKLVFVITKSGSVLMVKTIVSRALCDKQSIYLAITGFDHEGRAIVQIVMLLSTTDAKQTQTSLISSHANAVADFKTNRIESDSALFMVNCCALLTNSECDDLAGEAHRADPLSRRLFVFKKNGFKNAALFEICDLMNLFE